MRTLATLLPYLRRHRLLLIIGVLGSLADTFLRLVPAYLLGQTINLIAAKRPQSEVLPYVWWIMLFAVLDGVAVFIQRYMVSLVSRRIEYELRGDFFAHLQTLDAAFYKNLHTGDLMARATNDLNQVRMMLGPGVNGIISTPATFLVTLAFMFGINLKLALIVLVLMPLVTLVFYLLNGRMRRQYEQVQAQFGELSTRSQENLNSIRVIKAYGQEDAEIKRFAAANAQYIKLNLVYVLLSGLLWPLLGMLLGVTTAIVLVVGGGDVVTHQISLGQFVQFNLYLAQLGWPMIAMGWTLSLIQQGLASLGRLDEVMRRQPHIYDDPAKLKPATQLIRGEIEFKDVTLSYDDLPALEHVSFRVPAGSSLAVVGATGSGKSSLVNLITRVYDPQEGTIYIDGREISTIPLDELRQAIGYVPQDNFLFSVPIRDNVAFGLLDEHSSQQRVIVSARNSTFLARNSSRVNRLPLFNLSVNLDNDPLRALREVSDDERKRIEQAVEVARLSKDLEQFPQGIDTMIGERGVTLSGGQKQRTAIARAIVRDPAILILDDSLSSVDTGTASEILAGLREVMKQRTSIIIAQRIATVQNADQIILLEDGRIVERGSHMELVALGGRYTAMYRRELLAQELGIEPEVAAGVS